MKPYEFFSLVLNCFCKIHQWIQERTREKVKANYYKLTTMFCNVATVFVVSVTAFSIPEAILSVLSTVVFSLDEVASKLTHVEFPTPPHG